VSVKRFIGPARQRAATSGFTLVELLVVVIIVGVSAALAMPLLVDQMRQRRLRETAQEVAAIYTNARLRAFGRGSAVLVQYTQGTGFTVRESIEGTAAATQHNNVNCAPEPGLGCLANDWANAALSRQLSTYQTEQHFRVVASDQAGAAVNTMSICFTPLGRSFISTNGTLPTTPMAGATTFTLDRDPGQSWSGGYRYFVAVLPNGVARLTRGEAAVP
jgi:type II secretion system protein H